MSDSNNASDSTDFMNSDSRQVAKRMLPTELTSSDHIIQPGESDRAPKFLVSPAGTGANRLMLTGVVTDTEDVGDDQACLRMRCTALSGGQFNVYAGQYQKDARSVVQQLEAPEFVQVIGKPNTLENDDGGVFTSIRPETVNVLSESEYFRLSAECAQHTVKRLTGEYGHEFFDEQAADLYDSDLTEDVYEAAVETLEEVAEKADYNSAENKLSREELEDMEYDELRTLVKKFENVNGSATADTIIDALADKPAPA